MPETYPRPPPRASPPPSCGSGHTWQIAEALGWHRAEAQRQTEILLSLLDRMIALPDDLADRMTERQPPSAPPASPPAPPSPPPSTLPQWMVAASLLATFTAVLAGKLPLVQAIEIVRKLHGLP